MKSHVKKNDVVVVISGGYRDKPEDVKQGKVAKRKVIAVNPYKGQVIVEGINIIRKAVRKSKDRPQGGFQEREGPIHISNVMLAETYDKKRARVGKKT